MSLPDLFSFHGSNAVDAEMSVIFRWYLDGFFFNISLIKNKALYLDLICLTWIILIRFCFNNF
jgi:hypothetical protein